MNSNVTTQIFLAALTLSILIFTAAPPAFSEGPVQGTILLTKDTASTEHQSVFSPYDTIYAAVTLSGLAPGTYTADISWANAHGTVNQYTPIAFTVVSTAPHTFYSWFHLMKNGPTKKNRTGKAFDVELLGKWELRISIQDMFAQKLTFAIR